MRRASTRYIALLGRLDLRDTTIASPTDAALFLTRDSVTLEAAQEPAQKPTELSWWDWTVFLLQTAAEIEHSLMIQYLYAAYSLSEGPYKGAPPANAIQLARKWRRTVLGVAREEMGHLLTVQNLLHFIGGPLTFQREDFPYRSLLYPFQFVQEPLTKDSLAKYIVAEMPAAPAENLTEIKARASKAASGSMINRVGILYALLADIFADATKLEDPDLLADTAETVQGRMEDWFGSSIILARNVSSRAEAVEALRLIGEQGEGPWTSAAGPPSHYDRFLALYREYPETDSASASFAWVPTSPVPINPVTAAPIGASDAPHTVEISHPTSRLWAQLANVRYRMLLSFLAHALHLEGSMGIPSGRTAKGCLRDWAFEEMKGRSVSGLRVLAQKLALMPRREGTSADVESAGIPFELPYTLLLHEKEKQRWRQHLALIESSSNVMAALQSAGQVDVVLDELSAIDAERRTYIQSLL